MSADSIKRRQEKLETIWTNFGGRLDATNAEQMNEQTLDALVEMSRTVRSLRQSIDRITGLARILLSSSPLESPLPPLESPSPPIIPPDSPEPTANRGRESGVVRGENPQAGNGQAGLFEIPDVGKVERSGFRVTLQKKRSQASSSGKVTCDVKMEIVRTCGFDLHAYKRDGKMRGRVRRAADFLTDKYSLRTDDQIAALVRGFGIWFAVKDWRGQKGENPRPEHIIELWGDFAKYCREIGRVPQSKSDIK